MVYNRFQETRVATTTQPPTKLMTAEDLMRLPSDGNRYELVRGVLRTMSPPGYRHGEIMFNFGGPLRDYVKAHRLGSVAGGDPGCKLARDPDVVLAPDVAFVQTDRLSSVKPTGYFEGAPDLVVEVVSPSDTHFEVEEKVDDWLSLGCRMVVVVSDRKRTVTVYRSGQSPRVLRGNDVFDGDDVVPGFQLPLPDIFA